MTADKVFSSNIFMLGPLKSIRPMRKTSKMLAFAGIIALISYGCTHQGTVNLNGNEQTRKSSETAASSVKDKTALEQMEIAFEAGYKKEEINARLDKALELYRLMLTEENYSRAGSTLVALRQKNRTREMDILSYMIKSHVPSVRIHFAEAAGMASAMLVAGNTRRRAERRADSHR